MYRSGSDVGLEASIVEQSRAKKKGKLGEPVKAITIADP
jgi:hypothetical protein